MVSVINSRHVIYFVVFGLHLFSSQGQTLKKSKWDDTKLHLWWGGGGVIIQFIFAIDQMKYNFKPDILNKKWFLLIKSITGPLA